MSPQRLVGRRALVTGSTSGIGKAIALAFAAEGAQVVFTGRRAELGRAAVEEAGSGVFVEASLRGDSIGPFVDRVVDAAGGPIEILVNNAAFLAPSVLTVDTTQEHLDAALDLSIKVPFALTAALAPAMIAAGRGAIVNIGSINGTVGMAQAALYGATKAALHSLTKSWAAELGPHGVRVNTVAPGPTEAEWSRDLRPFLEAMTAPVPSGRMSRLEEVAAAVVFLASDEASHIHGATLPVDGGMSAIWPRAS